MNLTVTTTKRRYYFDYTIYSRTPNRFGDEVMYAVRFVYPPAAENALTLPNRWSAISRRLEVPVGAMSTTGSAANDPSNPWPRPMTACTRG